jgi:transcriptional antiterminator NusG
MSVEKTQDREWYVIHTYSGYENKVKANLEKRVESMNMGDKIFRILVPMEEEIQVKDGKPKVTPKKIYPGYVLVEMNITEDSWYVVRNTPGVTGFVGSGSKPIPLQDHEIRKIFKHIGMEEKQPKVDFKIHENVRITSGPFENFIGTIEEIHPQKGKLKVKVSMFGRETPVELDFTQVVKM